jgi:hypothetical protein
MPPLRPRGRQPRKLSPFVAALVPVAQDLLALTRAQTHGFTVSDLRDVARARGLLTGKETPRQLSSLGHVFRAAGGIASGTRPATLGVSKSVRQAVWKPGPYKPEIPSVV